MAADSRCNAGGLHFMASGRMTVERALVAPKRLAGRAAIRCPGRFAAVPGGARMNWGRVRMPRPQAATSVTSGISSSACHTGRPNSPAIRTS
jgi:hypothetical protein